MNKKILVFGGIGLLLMVFVAAAIINYSVSRDVTVNPSFTFEGDNSADVDVAGGESVISEDLNVESDTSVNVPLSIGTTPEEVGIKHTINYLLDNLVGTCLPYPQETCEKRIDFDGMALSDLNSISWDADVVDGYLPHVDVFLDNGETLVFEYAKVDAPCDNAPYPTGEVNTFDDKGIVDNDAKAWLSSGVAGYCGLPEFDNNHKSLSDWKAFYPTATITRIEIEVDNWISPSNSVISSVLVNGIDVSEEPFLLPEGELDFNVETEFDVGITGDYTITTSVKTR